MLKWIVFAVLILAVIFFLLREGLKFLANFTDWARNLLNALRKPVGQPVPRPGTERRKGDSEESR